MRRYSKEETDFLVKNYSKGNKEDILDGLPTRSWASIKEKAGKLGLSRLKYRSNKLKKLTETNLFNAYWWGFILADGHISKKHQLVIQVHTKDLAHLEKIAKYLNANINYPRDNMCRIDIMDHINGSILSDKLDIKHNKTYHPPRHIDYLDSIDLKISLLLGLIDGDGYILFKKGRFRSIKIEVHSAWYDFLENLCNEIKKHTGMTFTMKRFIREMDERTAKLCSVYIGKNSTYQLLLDFIKNNDIPVLKRKWYYESGQAKTC